MRRFGTLKRNRSTAGRRRDGERVWMAHHTHDGPSRGIYGPDDGREPFYFRLGRL